MTGETNGAHDPRLLEIADQASLRDGELAGEPVRMELVTPYLQALEEKDGLTAAHTWRVTLYTRLLSEEFGLDADRVARIGVAAALHDIGKLDVPRAILQKPGPLTDEEFAIIKTHPMHGWRRLRELGVTDQVALNLVRYHHERIDGKGYPDGVAGETIPIGARFFAVIDTFDALTSIRPYRADVGHAAGDRAFEELHKGVNTRYAPQAVEAFFRLYRRGEVDWIMEYFNDTACPLSYGEFHHVGKVGRSSAVSRSA